METKKNNKATPLKPYDDSMWDHYAMYDNSQYLRDKELCNESNIVKESGNVIKSYRCQIKDPYEVKH